VKNYLSKRRPEKEGPREGISEGVNKKVLYNPAQDECLEQ